MTCVVNEIKNWHLFTDVFGDEYDMHDAVIKRFDLNGDRLTVVVNTVYEVVNGMVYDITIQFSKLIRLDYKTEIGNDYVYGIEVEKIDYFKNLFVFTFDDVCLTIECFDIELISVTESERFQRGVICLDNPDQTADSGKTIWRS